MIIYHLTIGILQLIEYHNKMNNIEPQLINENNYEWNEDLFGISIADFIFSIIISIILMSKSDGQNMGELIFGKYAFIFSIMVISFFFSDTIKIT